MLQYAIEQSMVQTTNRAASIPNITDDTDKVDIWEALRGQGTDGVPDEDEQLQRYNIQMNQNIVYFLFLIYISF